MAQWLHRVGANIHAEDDRAIYCACGNGHVHVIRWLLTLDYPDHLIAWLVHGPTSWDPQVHDLLYLHAESRNGQLDV